MLRSSISKIENPKSAGDFGFRVFKLDTSNIRAWEPNRADLDQTLLDGIDHIKPDRSEEDILYELLLKLGLDLCAPIETRTDRRQVGALNQRRYVDCLPIDEVLHSGGSRAAGPRNSRVAHRTRTGLAIAP